MRTIVYLIGFLLIFSSSLFANRIDRNFENELKVYYNILIKEIEIEKKILLDKEIPYTLKHNLIKKYGLKTFLKPYGLYEKEVKKRVAIIPFQILLAQASIESNNGKSNIAKKANNLFGIWSFNDNHPSIKITTREDGTPVKIRKFEGRMDSVRYYMELLNSGKVYNQFRTLREQNVSNEKMVEGLINYSELKLEYVNLLKKTLLEITPFDNERVLSNLYKTLELININKNLYSIVKRNNEPNNNELNVKIQEKTSLPIEKITYKREISNIPPPLEEEILF